jgi:hypothetical protein
MTNEKVSNPGMGSRLAVSMNEAASMITCSRRTLENYIAAKLLPSRKVGKRRVVLLRDLEKFLRVDQPSVGHKCQPDARESTSPAHESQQ